MGPGLGPVKALLAAEGEATGVLLDEEVLMEAGKAYVARFRLADGQRLVRDLVTEPGPTRTITFAGPLPLAQAPEPGDLFMFGELGREVARRDGMPASLRRIKVYLSVVHGYGHVATIRVLTARQVRQPMH